MMLKKGVFIMSTSFEFLCLIKKKKISELNSSLKNELVHKPVGSIKN